MPSIATRSGCCACNPLGSTHFRTCVHNMLRDGLSAHILNFYCCTRERSFPEDNTKRLFLVSGVALAACAAGPPFPLWRAASRDTEARQDGQCGQSSFTTLQGWSCGQQNERLRMSALRHLSCIKMTGQKRATRRDSNFSRSDAG